LFITINTPRPAAGAHFAAFSVKGEDGERVLMQKNLGEGLGLRPDHNYFCIFRDQITGLEYIRNNQEMCDKGCILSWMPTSATSLATCAR